MTNIIETELVRRNIYNNIIDKISEKLKNHIKQKEIQHLLLRYIFNKIIERRQHNDPIIIPEYSDICFLQIKKDFEFKDIKIDAKTFVKEVDELLKEGENVMKTIKINDDKYIKYISDKNHFLYNNKIYKNISNLGDPKHPELFPYCIALNIRYTYLHLSTHGLARDYYKMSYNKYDGFEIFASSFNHYFDCYHSAFPDLEKPFGSLGSFFENVEPELLKCSIQTVLNSIKNDSYSIGQEKYFTDCFFLSDIYKKEIKQISSFYKSSKKKLKNKVMFVNPPFDMILMSIVFFIFEHLNVEYKTILTVPNWSNFLFLEKLKKHPKTKKTIIYPKGTLKFINHMNNKKIFPCDIAEIYLYPNVS